MKIELNWSLALLVASVVVMGFALGGCALLRDGLGKTDFFERLERQGQ